MPPKKVTETIDPTDANAALDIAGKYDELAQAVREYLAEIPCSFRALQMRDRMAVLV